MVDRIKKLRVFFAFALLLLAAACAAPGAPPLRTAGEAEDPLIPNCQNVSPDARVEQYDTEHYLTTWGSAAYEGAAQGFSEGLGHGPLADAVRKVVLHPAENRDAIFNSLPAGIEPFCRSYNTDFADVNTVVRQILPLLGNQVLVSKPQIGVFVTAPVERSMPVAKWRDFYVITVTPLGLRIEVKVLRAVFICRDGVTFNQGISVGQNETWVFTQIADRLARMPAPVPPDVKAHKSRRQS
jgi:hypothetical protein